VIRRIPIVLVVLAVGAGCDAPSAETSTTTTTTAPTTTTTLDPGLVCSDLEEIAADLLIEVVHALEEVTVEQFADKARWPEALLRLEADGVALDRAATELGCDPGTIQQAAIAAVAGMDPEGRLAPWLLELLGA
jgi:hypothetical protein